jgi:hypothetical protein
MPVQIFDVVREFFVLLSFVHFRFSSYLHSVLQHKISCCD